MNKGKQIIIISAPSGAGKTTIVKYLLKTVPGLGFSVSATTRKARHGELHGKDYYFLSPQEFDERIAKNEFLEYEAVYAGTKYGTLRSEVDRIWSGGRIPIFDVDVSGGMSIKKIFPQKSLLLFIMPPSVNILKERILKRSFIPDEELNRRLLRASREIEYSAKFDEIVYNTEIDRACKDAERLVCAFIRC